MTTTAFKTLCGLATATLVLALTAAPAVSGLVTEKMAPDQTAPEMQSPVAGTAGSTRRVMIGEDVSLPNDPLRYYGITSVMLEEAGDKPCRVVLFGGALDGNKGPDDRKLGEDRLSGCNPKVPIDTIHPTLTGAKNRFVIGVKVCDSKNRNNDRIKGLSLLTGHVKPDGSVSKVEPPSGSGDNNPNCGTYSQAVFCPDWYPPDPPIYARPMIAVGLLMHHDGDAFTGVQLVCRGVKSGSTTTLSEDSIGY